MNSQIKLLIMRLAAVSCLLVLCTSCAFHRTAVITSSPPGASVYVDGNFAGKTPYTVIFLLNNELFTAYEPVESPKQIKVEAEGYEPAVKVYNRIDRMSEIPRHLTHFDLKPSSEATRPESTATYHQNKVSVMTPVTVTGEMCRWAVVIGVSSYRDTRITSLRYASADAEAFREWAVSQGGYSPACVKTLVDKDATATNIRKALFEWLKQALEEDIVTIFFAGHGSPESPDSPKNLYLLPYDTDYDSIAASAFPMWDIETALKRHIKAKRVIVIADACHSGGVGESFDIARRSGRSMKVVPVSSGLEALSNVQEGICVITASGDNQFSQEGKQWGGGHGVFTHYLLKGLKGDADYNRDGKATLGEMVPYLSQQVRYATKSAQCPTVAGKFDPALTIGR